MDSVIAKAQQDFDKGNYRWVAQVMNNAVFAFPDNEAARKLQANALEQLGYQAEAATWRNAYLMGADELRNGIADSEKVKAEDNVATDLTSGLSTFTSLTLPMFFDYTAIKLNGPKANGKHIAINWMIECDKKTNKFKSDNEIEQYEEDMCGNYAMIVENSTLVYFPQNDYPNLYDKALKDPTAVTLTMTRNQFDALMLAQSISAEKAGTEPSKIDAVVQELINSGKVSPNGKAATLHEFFSLLDTFSTHFPIVWPQNAEAKITDRN